MQTGLKEIADRVFKKQSPSSRVSERQRSEAAALQELEDQRLEQRRKTENLRKARLAARKSD